MPGQDSIITHCLVNMFNFCFSRGCLLAEIERFVHFSFIEIIMLLELTDRHYKYLPPSLTPSEVHCHLAAEDINHYSEAQANVSKPGRACICFLNSLPYQFFLLRLIPHILLVWGYSPFIFILYCKANNRHCYCSYFMSQFLCTQGCFYYSPFGLSFRVLKVYSEGRRSVVQTS